MDQSGCVRLEKNEMNRVTEEDLRGTVSPSSAAPCPEAPRAAGQSSRGKDARGLSLKQETDPDLRLQL